MNIFLPVVNPAISGPLERELADKCDVPYLKQQLARLDEENPIVAKFIRDFSKKTKDKLAVMFCGVIIYKMLESQAEADQMNIQFGD